MEAARRLDIKGHNVTLIEGSNQLGGTLRFASLAYEPNERLLDWLKRQVGQSRIDVRLGTLATPESIAALSPEMVIVRSEEHTSELQSLMRNSYAVFCLKKKNIDSY